MEDIEVAEEEIENSFHEDCLSDNESTISEKEVHLYSLIYHVEHTQPNQISKYTEISDPTVEKPEIHVSARSKAFRLNGVNKITEAPSVVHSMHNSRIVRNHIKKVAAKLDSMRKKNITETNEHGHSKSEFRGKKQSNVKNNENLSKGINGGVLAVEPPQTDKNKQTMTRNEESSNTTHISGMCNNQISENARPEADEMPSGKEAEISKYDITLNERNNVESSGCLIVISDSESVDSIIEVKPPTPPPPVVIHIDSSDEASQIKEKEISIQKESVNPCPPPSSVEIDVTSSNVVALEKSPTGPISSAAPSENSLIVSFDVGCAKEDITCKDSSITESVKKTHRARKRKKKCAGSKSRKLKPESSVHYQNVPGSWTSEMIRFYCHSWGGDTFDHEELQKQMSGNSSNWKILDVDLLGPMPRSGPYRRSRCGNCNQIGHIFEQCPDPIKEMCCCMCGEKGHTKRFCPNKICLQCGRPANKYSIGCHKCFYNSKPCNTCGQYGHLMWLCPEAWRIYHSSTTQEIPVCTRYELKTPNDQFCCNCARRGHTSHNCKFPNNETYENYVSDPIAQYNSAFKYKNQNHKHNGYHDNFSSVNMNRKYNKNKNKYNVTVVNDSDPSTTFTHKRKKFSNAARKRMKKKQKKNSQKKTTNLE